MRARRRPAHGARTAAWLAALLVAGPAGMVSCMTSPSPRTAARDEPPYGALVTVQLVDGRRQQGELLAVQDSSVVVVLANRVTVGQFADITRVDLGDRAGVSGWLDRGADLRTAGGRRRGQLASRFPYGLPEPALQALLARYAQTAPDTLRVGAR